MKLTIYTDGGSLGNPGPSAIAYVIYMEDKILARQGRFIGHATNNQAEYQALLAALEKVRSLTEQNQLEGLEKIEVVADSELLVRQVNGFYKVKNALIREYIVRLRSLEAELNVPINYKHVLREKNRLADSLVKKALKQAGFSI